MFALTQKMLHAPMFYLSEYLDANRQEYYDGLLAVSRDGEWTEWCRFFLQAIQKQATENEAKARKILDLYERRKDWIVERTHSIRSLRSVLSISSSTLRFSMRRILSTAQGFPRQPRVEFSGACRNEMGCSRPCARAAATSPLCTPLWTC